MHAARAAVRSSTRRPITPTYSSSRLFASRSLSTTAPAARAKGTKDSQGEAPLASRLKQKRSHSETPRETDAGDKPTSTTSRPDSGAAATRPTSNANAPHKLRVPNVTPTGQAVDPIAAALKGSGPNAKGKQRKRSASVEGFRAKRHAMQRMRREMMQAVQEAHGDAWLAGEVSSLHRQGAAILKPLPREARPVH